MLKPGHVTFVDQTRKAIDYEKKIDELYERNARLAVAFQYLIVHIHRFDSGHTACGSYVDCANELCQKVKKVIVNNEDVADITRFQRSKPQRHADLLGHSSRRIQR